MLRWIIELVRVDILHEPSLLSQYMALPIIGHLQEALNICKYIKANANQGWLAYNPLNYDIDWKPIGPNEISPIERAISMK